MRKNIYLLMFIFCLFSCTQTKEKVTTNKGPFLVKVEDFNLFMDEFKKDSSFQVSRIDNPLIIETIDDESHGVQNKSMQKVTYVSFDQKDWKEKISIESKALSSDTIVVVLQGIDTGILIEHYFAIRNGKWFLFKIKNFSD